MGLRGSVMSDPHKEKDYEGAHQPQEDLAAVVGRRCAGAGGAYNLDDLGLMPLDHASASFLASMSSSIFFAGPLRRSGLSSQRQTVER